MARPFDQDKRAQLLADIAKYIGENGLADISLRPLAAGLGTSSRMLIYYFGTKEELLSQVLTTLHADLGNRQMRDVTDVESLRRALWAVWETSLDELVVSRIWVELIGLAPVREGFYREVAAPVITRIVESVADAMIRCGCNRDRALANATFAMSAYRGILEDRLITNSIARTDRAIAQLIDLVVRDVAGAT